MNAPAPIATLMSGDDFRESLRRYKPRVFLDGQQVGSVVDVANELLVRRVNLIKQRLKYDVLLV